MTCAAAAASAAALARLAGPLKARLAARSHARARSSRAAQVFIAAGEPSGDAFAARLMAALRAAAPCAVDFRGIGGCAVWSRACESAR